MAKKKEAENAQAMEKEAAVKKEEGMSAELVETALEDEAADIEPIEGKDENAVETMQEKLSEIESALKTGTKEALNEISKLAGKKKEEFSSAYSMMENRMTRFTKS